jgi:ppGpp synthetase/RelA/SpoT-type nucleotidyltranferase
MSDAAIRRPWGADADPADALPYDEDMADFVRPKSTPRQVRDASDALRKDLAYCPETVETFLIAHNWRSAHILPMTRVRRELSGKVGKYIGSGITAARLKRMSSIRRKLRKEKFSLYSIQDIAGCRAVVSTVDNVRNLVEHYTAGNTRHKVANNRDLIQNPRRGGYRSHHLIVEFRAGSEALAPWNKLLVEMQIRTKLQHAWATAVEAVGLMRGENLKAGEGNTDLLRLFTLMSAEFCEEEGQPLVPDAPSNAKERKAELRELARRLRAVSPLES